MSLVKPVLFPPWNIKMSAEEKAYYHLLSEADK